MAQNAASKASIIKQTTSPHGAPAATLVHSVSPKALVAPLPHSPHEKAPSNVSVSDSEAVEIKAPTAGKLDEKQQHI
jgi:hypothetical protein